MIFGCCTNMLSRPAGGTGIENLGYIKAAGYEYVELPMAQMAQLSAADFDRLAADVEASGLKCAACNNLYPAAIKLTGPSVDRTKVMEYAEKAVGMARRLGAEILVMGSSGARNVPPGFPKSEAWKQLTGFLRDLDPIVRKAGITVVIEPLMKLESNIVNTVADGLRLAKEVDRENIKLLVDYYHFSVNRESFKSIEEAGSFIRHVHFARTLGRVFPQSPDEDDYKDFFTSLMKIGYNGRVSLEAFADKPEYELKNGLELVKRIAAL